MKGGFYIEIKTYEEALNYIIANKEKIPSLLEYELMTEDEVISYAYEIFEEINKPSKEPFIKPTLKAKDGYEHITIIKIEVSTNQKCINELNDILVNMQKDGYTIVSINYMYLRSRYYQYLMIRYK